MSHLQIWQNGRRWFGTAVIILGILLLLVILIPANAAVEIPDNIVRLQTANITLQPGVYTTSDGGYVVLQLDRNLRKAEIDSLTASGVRLLSYLGEDVFIAGIDHNALTPQVRTDYGIEAAVPWQAENKATPATRQHLVPDWARTDEGLLKLTILFFADVTPKEMEDILSKHVISYVLESPSLLWAVEIEPSKLEALLQAEGIHFVEPGPIPFQPVLDKARALIHVDEVQQASFTNDPPTIWYDGLTGKGVTLQVSEAVHDGHPDFIDADGQTRFVNPSPNSGGSHGTHVAGIIGGDGVLSASMQGSPLYANTGHWRGMAPEAALYDGGYSGGQGHLIDASNHSYVMTYGEYNSFAADVDGKVRGESGFDLRWPRIWAAANQGYISGYDNEEGYYSMYAPAKNSIAVGSVNANDGGLSRFSSMGPTFDGRIKPDVMAPGGNNHLPRDTNLQSDRVQIAIDYIRIINLRTGSVDAAWEFTEDGNPEGWFQTAAQCQIYDLTVNSGYLNFQVGLNPEFTCGGAAWGWNETLNLQADPDHVITMRYKMNLPAGTSESGGWLVWHRSEDTNHPHNSGKINFSSLAVDSWIVETVEVGQWGETFNNREFGAWEDTIDKLGMIPFQYIFPKIYSTFYDPVSQTYAYIDDQGTSMAAPAVTGGVGLILQQFHDQLGVDLENNPPLPSTIKAILVQTAEDMVHATADPRDPNNPDTNTPVLYYAGPDFATGYGLVNIKAAVDLVGADPGPGVSSRFIHESELDSYQKHVYEMVVTNADIIANNGQIKVTLAWDDYPGDPATVITTTKLVNDLDLYLIGPDDNIYLPWTLDPLPWASCDGNGPGCGDLDPIEPSDVVPAYKAADHRNNVEMVQVDTAVAGRWQIVVDVHAMPEPTQQYSLVGNSLFQATPCETCSSPVVVNDRYDVGLNQPLFIGAPGVLANDNYANGNPRTYYQDTGTKHLHELAWVDDQWHDTDLTAATGAPTFEILHGLTSTAVNGEPRVYYHAGWYIYELAWYSNAWHYRNLTPNIDWASAPSGSIKATTVNGDPRVYYLANDKHIHELAWFNDSWHYRDVTAVVDGSIAVAHSTIAVTTITNSDPRVYYMADSSDGLHIHELAWYEKVWHHRDITADAEAPLPAHFGMLTATTVGFLPRVYYETSDAAGPAEELHELAWTPPDEWQDNYLLTHGGLSLFSSRLSAMTTMNDIPRVYYAETVLFDPDIPGYIYEVEGAEDVWSHHELGEFQNSDGNENSLAVTTARLNPRVYYVNGDHHVREFALVNDEWSNRDITADVNGPDASGYILSATTAGGGNLTVRLLDDVTHGELTLDSDGSFLYEPNEGYIGEDSFTYVANDGTNDSNVVTVELHVYDPCAQAPGNLITNFCFADGTAPWEFWHSEFQGSYAASTNDPNVGQYSAEITIYAPGENIQLYQSGIELQPNTTYNLSFAARSKDGQDMSITMHKNTDPFENYGLSDHHVDLKPYWKLFSVTFTTPNISEMNDARLRFSPYVQNGTVYYIDKVVLRPVSNP